MRQRHTLAAILALSALALTVSSCGGDDGADGGSPRAPDSSESQSGVGAKRPQGAQQPRGAGDRSDGATSKPGPPADAFTPKPHRDSGGGSDQFIVKGGDNSVQEFGAEAGGGEFEQAAEALHNFLDARAERNWAAACSYLSTETKRGFAQLAGASRPAGCAATLAALSGKVPTSTLREAAVADVGSLRVEGDRAFIIYRGAPKGTIYAIPVAREDGSWRIGSLAGTPLN